MQEEYFDQWIYLFSTTVDELFEGKVAELAKTRAKSIGNMMLLKMINNV